MEIQFLSTVKHLAPAVELFVIGLILSYWLGTRLDTRTSRRWKIATLVVLLVIMLGSPWYLYFWDWKYLEDRVGVFALLGLALFLVERTEHWEQTSKGGVLPKVTVGVAIALIGFILFTLILMGMPDALGAAVAAVLYCVFVVGYWLFLRWMRQDGIRDLARRIGEWWTRLWQGLDSWGEIRKDDWNRWWTRHKLDFGKRWRIVVPGRRRKA